MLDTYSTIWNKVLLRCPAASSLLARDWVSHAFRQLAEKRRWSWKIKYGEFILPALTNAGTVTVTQNSSIVLGIGTNWDQSLVNQQFRIGIATPIYTITQVNSSTSLTIDLPWGGGNNSNVGYQIYQAYVTPPSDFQSLISVWDPAYNWQLWLNIHQKEINAWDAQRANTGPSSYLVSPRDYTTTYVGSIGSVLQVVGFGPLPVSTSQGQGYTGAVNAIFSLSVTLGGSSGTAQFQWKKNSGSYTTGVISSDGPQDLSDGVQVYWPDGVTYNLGDTFVIQCNAILQGGLPRYELWPHKQAQYVYPFLYEVRPPDLEDPGATLPRYIRGDVLLEMALASAARWPGPSQDKPSIYFNRDLATMHENRATNMIFELERQDDETYEQDTQYTLVSALPFAPFPFGDSNWLQSHAI